MDKRIVVDLFGADAGPAVVLEGAARCLERDAGLRLVLAGPRAQAEAALAGRGLERVEILDTGDFIAADEDPSAVFGGRDESSLVMALKALKAREDCAGLLTAGSTGAVLVGTICRLGLRPGMRMPALASWLPVGRGRMVCLVDCGANIDCTAHDLVRFACMGAEYAGRMTGAASPRVGLLNVGRERGKGTALLREAHGLLAESGLNFVGNVEGGDLYADLCDVIVCDGLSGNLLLKGTEAAGLDAMRLALEAAEALPEDRRGPMLALAERIRLQFDFNDQGGAVFLGPVKPVIKMHGCAGADTVVACVDQLARLVGGQ